MANKRRSYTVTLTYDEIKENCLNPSYVKLLLRVVDLIARNNEDSTAAYNKLITMVKKRNVSKNIFDGIKKHQMNDLDSSKTL